MPAFIPENGAVYWNGCRLTENEAQAILDIFEREGAAAVFNELYEALMSVGGVPRVTSLRQVEPFVTAGDALMNLLRAAG